MAVATKQGMPPVGSNDAALLILGSLPGDASLAAEAYYAHPSNQFWHLLGGAIGEDLAALAYPDRLDRLALRGIVLWDVVADAVRPGSLDGAMRSARPNPLAEFVARHPNLRAIAFNGRTAATLGRRVLGMSADLTLIDLPSSSAAFTRRQTEKSRDWAVLGDFAAPPISATSGR